MRARSCYDTGMAPELVELVCALASVIVFLLYLGELYKDTHSPEPRTAAGVIASMRIDWLANIIKRGSDIVCVQALRNWIMFASMMASASILGALAVVGFAVQEQPPVELFGDSWVGGIRTAGFARFKLLCLSGALLTTFLNFSSCVRYYNHIIVCVTDGPNHERRLAVASALLKRGASHQLSGTRCLYACVSMALWIAGPVWLLISTVAVVSWLRHLDRFPDPLPS